MKPLQLFVLLNVVYYFSLTLVEATTFTTPLATQLPMNNYYPAHASRQVNREMQHDRRQLVLCNNRRRDCVGLLSYVWFYRFCLFEMTLRAV